MDRLCGNCAFGGDAYDRYGNIDGQYVICQVKEAENRQRKPDRFQTTSAVSRMHHLREACLYWKPNPDKVPGEVPLPMQAQPYADQFGGQEAIAGDSIYDQMYGSSGGVPEPEPAPEPIHGVWRPPAYVPPPARSRDQFVNTAEHEAELKRLRSQLMQSEQMVQSLQNQNMLLAEENTRLKDENDKSRTRLAKLEPFDVALFAEVNYFALLGVKETSTPDQIKEAYRSRMKLMHPDRFINITQRMNLAYETLMDVEKRRKYLAQIKGRPHV